MILSKHIPNILTSLNLICGCAGIIAIFKDDIFIAATFIIIGAVIDFFDGFFAKILNAGSPLGVQLDSLADLITFGLLPALLYYQVLSGISEGIYPFFSLIMVVSSAFRLARFNIDDRQTENFIGLPTPANAFLTAGLIFIYQADWDSFSIIFSSPDILAVIILIQSFLLNSGIRFFSLKFGTLSWKENKLQYITITGGILFIGFLRLTGLFFCVLTYIVLAFLDHFLFRKLSET